MTLPHRQHGLSLIELMVAVGLSLVVLTAVSASYLSGRKASLAAEDRLALQQDARLALATLSRDLRMAGVFGCAIPAMNNTVRNGSNASASQNVPIVSHYSGDATDQFDSQALGFRALSPGDAAYNAWMAAAPLGGVTSPMLVVQFGQGTAAITASASVAASGVVWLTRLDALPPSERGLDQNASYLALASCSRVDLFKVDGTRLTRSTSSGLQLSFGSNDRVPVGTAAGIVGQQSGSLDLMRLVSRAYVVGSYRGQKALYLYERAEDGSLVGPSEVAPNVTRLDVEYGTVNACEGSAAGASITYSKTPDDWAKVDLVRVLITMESPRPATVSTVTGDGTLTRQYGATIALRGSNLCVTQAKTLAEN